MQNRRRGQNAEEEAAPKCRRGGTTKTNNRGGAKIKNKRRGQNTKEEEGPTVGGEAKRQSRRCLSFEG